MELPLWMIMRYFNTVGVSVGMFTSPVPGKTIFCMLFLLSQNPCCQGSSECPDGREWSPHLVPDFPP